MAFVIVKANCFINYYILLKPATFQNIILKNFYFKWRWTPNEMESEEQGILGVVKALVWKEF